MLLKIGGMVQPWELSAIACLAKIMNPRGKKIVRPHGYKLAVVLFSIPCTCVVEVLEVPLLERFQGIVYVDVWRGFEIVWFDGHTDARKTIDLARHRCDLGRPYSPALPSYNLDDVAKAAGIRGRGEQLKECSRFND
jgi:hypothetical protein